MVAVWVRRTEAATSTFRLPGGIHMIPDYPWGRFYEVAILETDRSKLTDHIRLAEQAITARVQELKSDHGGTEEERSAIRDALSGLKTLRKEALTSLSEGTFRKDSLVDAALPSNSEQTGQE
jgi:hypothetical protein